MDNLQQPPFDPINAFGMLTCLQWLFSFEYALTPHFSSLKCEASKHTWQKQSSKLQTSHDVTSAMNNQLTSLSGNHAYISLKFVPGSSVAHEIGL